MKKLSTLLILVIVCLSIVTISYSQGTPTLKSTPKGQVVLGPNRDGAMDCPEASIFSQAPINMLGGYFSDNGSLYNGQEMIENFYGLTVPIGGLTFWGIYWDLGECWSGGSDNFYINFYQDNAGSVGNLVQSYYLNLSPTATGSFSAGSQILRYDATLSPLVNLTGGWVKIFRDNTSNSTCEWAWVDTSNGDGFAAFQFTAFGETVYYNNGFNESFCLTGSNKEVPVSNWAMFIGIGLILAFAVVRFRKVI